MLQPAAVAVPINAPVDGPRHVDGAPAEDIAARGVLVEDLPLSGGYQNMFIASMLVDGAVAGVNALLPQYIASPISVLARTPLNVDALSRLYRAGRSSAGLGAVYGIAITYAASAAGRQIAQVLLPGSPLVENILSDLGKVGGMMLTDSLVTAYVAKDIPSSILRGGDVLVAAVGADIAERLADTVMPNSSLRTAVTMIGTIAATEVANKMCKYKDRDRLPHEAATAPAKIGGVAYTDVITGVAGYALQQIARGRVGIAR